jgi:KDO2-lipid IV(A) lauroyltransferase
MALLSLRLKLRLRRFATAGLGFLTVHMLRAMRMFPPDAMSNFAGAVLRTVGPWLPENRVGRANLVAAFPEKTPAEIDRILRGAWDSLGRVSAEFAHIDRLWDYHSKPGQTDRRIMASDESERIVQRLRDDGKPAIVFSAHLANWELAAVAAHAYGLSTNVLYRRPNLKAFSDEVVALRTGCMGTLVPTTIGAPNTLVAAMQRGEHIAMLVDQYHSQGVPVTFFGRRTRANALLAWLVDKVDCPVHGIRVVRHPGNRFQLKMTEAIPVTRDATGKVDAERTMQTVTDVIEGWVREYPEQWLWLHRRWRGD